MKVRLTWVSQVQFIDTTTGSQDALEGRALETLLKEMFRRICYEACSAADKEDEVPLKVGFTCDIEAFDDEGQPLEDRTPRGLFELLPKEDRERLQKGFKKGVNHGG